MYNGAFAITPHDTTLLDRPTRAIYVGGAGDITLKTLNDTTAVLLKAVPVGTILPIQTKNVMSTGTTATLLVALY